MTFDNEDLVTPILLSTIAGLSTTLGACFIYCIPVKNGSRQVPAGAMSFSLALAAGVMITISFVSILPECFIENNRVLPLGWTLMTRIISFLFGAGVYFILSWCMTEPEQLLHDNISTLVGSQKPKYNYDDTLDDLDTDSEEQRFLSENIRNRHFSPNSRNSSSNSLVKEQTNTEKSHNSVRVKDSLNILSWTMGKDLNKEHQKAWRVAMMLFISLLIHNFPEGLAVAASSLENAKLGITVTIGIIIHNIPEGIAIAIPCLAARPDRPWLSFILASVSGLAEPAGALIAIFFLKDVDSQSGGMINLKNILGFVAGIMVTVSVVELFPQASRHSVDTKKYFWSGTLLGIIVMVITELYL